MSQLLRIMDAAIEKPEVPLSLDLFPVAEQGSNRMTGNLRLGEETFPLEVRNFRASFAIEQTMRGIGGNNKLPRNMSAYLSDPDAPLEVKIGDETTVISNPLQAEAQFLYLLGAEYTRSVP